MAASLHAYSSVLTIFAVARLHSKLVEIWVVEKSNRKE